MEVGGGADEEAAAVGAGGEGLGDFLGVLGEVGDGPGDELADAAQGVLGGGASQLRLGNSMQRPTCS